MRMSSHAVEVVRLDKFHPHPNADRLAIVDVFGHQVCGDKDEVQPGAVAAYIPPDSVAPDRPEFAFLDGHRRIRAKKLRGIISFGLLVKAPGGAAPGDDVAERLGITHYEPPLRLTSGGED